MTSDASLSDPPTRKRIMLVTGPSGGGRSTAINALEDLGFEAIDNLPLSLVRNVLEGMRPDLPLALGLDVRNRDFSTAGVLDLYDGLARDPACDVALVYLDCADDVLIRRFSETRRPHPLAPTDAPVLAVVAEKTLLAPIRGRADHLIDTSQFTPHDLRDELRQRFDSAPQSRMSISLHSFSYKRGLPRGLDLVFDCRFLNNPHWDPVLREQDGRSQAVQDYVTADEDFPMFREKLLDLLHFVIPRHRDEGKTHLAIGFGCSGGRHRSVSLVELLFSELALAGLHVSKRHRELERSDSSPVFSGRDDEQGLAVAGISE